MSPNFFSDGVKMPLP